jgi:hypothetical protein
MVEASTYDKYSLGDSRTIIYDFLLFKLMVSSIESSCLYGLVAGTDQPPQEPVAPFSLSDLINQANLKTPKKPEFTTTSHRYLICNREEFVHLDAENYSEIDEQNMNHFMNTCSPQLKLTPSTQPKNKRYLKNKY